MGLKKMSEEILSFRSERDKSQKSMADMIAESIFGTVPEATDELGKPIEVEIVDMNVYLGLGPGHGYTLSDGSFDFGAIEIETTVLDIRVTIRRKSDR